MLIAMEILPIREASKFTGLSYSKRIAATRYDPQGPGKVVELDVSRIREDTGYEPQYNLERAVA
jgi:hypothetical protein